MNTKLSNMLVLYSVILSSLFSISLTLDHITNSNTSDNKIIKVQLNSIRSKISQRLKEGRSDNSQNQEIKYLEDDLKSKILASNSSKSLYTPDSNESVFDSVSISGDFINNNLYSIPEDYENHINMENKRIIYGITTKPNKNIVDNRIFIETKDKSNDFTSNSIHDNLTETTAKANKLGASVKFTGFLSFD